MFRRATRCPQVGLLAAGVVLALPALAPAQSPHSGSPAAAVPGDRPFSGIDGSARTWVDFDGDGLLDLYVLTPRAEDRLLLNMGDGTFENVTEVAQLAGNVGSRQASWEDYDEDGFVDLLLVTGASSLRLFRGSASGLFDEVTESAARFPRWGVLDARWIDFDADGHADLELVTTGGLSLFRNLGQGALEAVRLDLPAPGIVPAPAVGPRPGADDRSRDGEEAVPRAAPSPPPAASGSGAHPSRVPVPPAGAPSPPKMPAPYCTPTIMDQATGGCVEASSDPMLGKLYPLGPELNIDGDGEVGIGTTSPGAKLEVAGDLKCESLSVSSGAHVPNLNVDLLDGLDSSDFSQFGNLVDEDEIAGDAVTASKIAAGAVGTSEIADGSVSSSDLAGALTIDSLSTTSGLTTHGDVRVWDKIVFPIDGSSMDTAGINSGGNTTTVVGFNLESYYKNITSREIDCPAPGYVLAIGTARLKAYDNGWNEAVTSLSETSATEGGVLGHWAIDPKDGTDPVNTITVQHLMWVSAAGKKKFYFVAKEFDGDVRVLTGTLTLVYVPKAY